MLRDHRLRVKSPSEKRRDASRTRWSEEEAMDATRDRLALSLRFSRWGKFITNGWNSTESVVYLDRVYSCVARPYSAPKERVWDMAIEQLVAPHRGVHTNHSTVFSLMIPEVCD